MAHRSVALISFLFILSLSLLGWLVWQGRPSADELPSSVREIAVDNYNFGFEPKDILVTEGEQLRFVLTNSSPTFHTFTIAPSVAEKKTILLNVDLDGGETITTDFTVPIGVTSLYLY